MSALPWVTHVERYLALRRAMGFELGIAGRQLLQFARFAHAARATALTIDLALAWASAASAPTPLTRARRIELVRPFARYLQQVDPATEVPERGVFGRAHQRLAPHILAPAEISDLLAAAARLPPAEGLRPFAYQTLFGLLAATGLRLGEALRLELQDVDLAAGMLTIRRTKFRKSRWVAMHCTTVAHLACYLDQRRGGLPATDRVFVGSRGRAISVGMADYVFKKLREELGWQPRGAHRAVRIYDLRHTFITRRLASWQAQGTDIDHAMLALSTYVGHAKVTDTYWYLTATPELMQTASGRFEQFAKGGGHD
ncbi:MAG TPA: tyrosine-type recombinase/integrase [Xanthomonadales bacterium]|nr:tyrosine-type recombinase/integrase [Xanthomonadales bacterium]